MKKETKNKIKAINEAINEELVTLKTDLIYRIERIEKFKGEFLKMLEDEENN